MRTSTNNPNETQEGRVLEVLRAANGGWVNKQYFIRDMFLTQAGRAIFNLENEPRWRSEYGGYRIEHSDFKDEFGFKSYRLVPILEGQASFLFDYSMKT